MRDCKNISQSQLKWIFVGSEVNHRASISWKIKCADESTHDPDILDEASTILFLSCFLQLFLSHSNQRFPSLVVSRMSSHFNFLSSSLVSNLCILIAQKFRNFPSSFLAFIFRVNFFFSYALPNMLLPPFSLYLHLQAIWRYRKLCCTSSTR